MSKIMDELRNEAYIEGFKEGFIEGFTKGFKEGFKEGLQEAAIRMLEDGRFSLEEIVDSTMLTLEEVKQLEAERKA